MKIPCNHRAIKRAQTMTRHFIATSAACLLAVPAVMAMPLSQEKQPPQNQQPAQPEGPQQVAELALQMQQALYGERFAASPDDGWTIYQELLAAYESLAAAHNDPPVAKAGDPRIVIWPGLIYESPTDILAYTGLPPDQAAETLKRTRAALVEAHDQGEGGVYPLWRPLRDRYRFAIPSQEGSMIEWKLPELASSRGLARLGAARLYLAAERGDGPAVAEAYEDLLALSRAASARPAGLSALVGVALNALANIELRDALSLHLARAAGRPLDPAFLQSLIAAMERQLPAATTPGVPPPHPGTVWMLKGERIAAIDSISAALDRHARGKRVAEPVQLRAQTRARIDTYYNEAVAVAQLPRSQRAARLTALDATLGGADLPSLALSVVASPVGRTLTAFDQLALDTQATRTLLAILLFEARTGKLPESLAALVPAYLAAPPIDPWNAEGLVYRVLEAPDDNGRRFLLYSKGADGQDNGGTTDPTGKTTPFTDAGRGTDAVYTPVSTVLP